MKKKVNVFGKSIPVLAIFVLGMAVVSAALLPFFGQITGNVTVSQGLYLNNLNHDKIQEFSFVPFTSLEEKTFTDAFFLENDATVEGVFSFDTECTTLSAEPCDSGITTTFEYLLDASAGSCDNYPNPTCEKRIAVDGMPLSALETISWDANVIEGYAPHVDLKLDNGKSLTFEYATIDSDCNVPAMYPTGKINTFGDMGIVYDNAYAWESIPGACGVSAFDAQHKTLAEWKAKYPEANIVRIEVEVDNWIPLNDPTMDEANSNVWNILVNGNPVEISHLYAEERADFNIINYFPKMLLPDTYTITTTVDAV